MLLGTQYKLNKSEGLKVKVTEGNLEKILHGEECLKILGIHIDQTLNWDRQTSQIKKRATNAIRNVHRANQLLPMKQKRVLYNSLITPHFTYGDIIWNKCGNANTNKLQQAQNYAAKSILGVSRYSSSRDALQKLELLPLQEKRNLHTAVFVKKILDGKAPDNLQMKYNSQQRPTSLRPGNLQLPRHSTQSYQNGPFYSSLKIWNSTPPYLRTTNLNMFKDKLQKYKLSQFLEH